MRSRYPVFPGGHLLAWSKQLLNAVRPDSWLQAWQARPLPERLSLLVSGLLVVFLFCLTLCWLHLSRLSIHEEVQAARRVSQQWLQAMVVRSAGQPAAELLGIVRDAGRIRANAITVYAATEAAPRYVSPASTYKAGRDAPAWFAALLAPDIAPLAIRHGDLRIVLEADSSRAILDAWDDLLLFGSWAGGLLIVLFFAVRFALRSALRPLHGLRLALQQTGEGDFAVRLPVLADPELKKLALAFNQMADSLTAAVKMNVQLESERQRIGLVESALQAERVDMARELHDELAQGITAVRALAAAIVQRINEDTAVKMMATRIVSVTQGLQEEVRVILLRLRSELPGSLPDSIATYVEAWQDCHGGVAIKLNVALTDTSFPAPVARVCLRLVKEALTNVIRHSAADSVVISLTLVGGRLGISVADNGEGKETGISPQPGSGLGLAGLRERVALLGGEIDFGKRQPGGWLVRAWLPLSVRSGTA
ncbi:HAMP domain-containing sensor histidine kinase [Quatrionicoccus australiensis]|uniref:HAMP domain-containing sensor histidine kinase n=1 Tax=Quatrionicoccus australiensis TaxID=138118 RepID=UPI001CFB402C|nr:sensor histidine kinase [Quatrionicoccus australiensis]MCB4358727.1 sensor histidine kinase [Quatrionicoccus australiensis]